jgi:hypothetical protein
LDRIVLIIHSKKFKKHAMSLKKISALLLGFVSVTAWAQAALENPAANSTESGIGIISGFHCSAKNISFKLNGQDIGKAGTGTDRGDTQGLCGRSDTGFSLLFNFNLLEPGRHSLSMFADGQLFETRTFNTTRSAGQEFAQGKSKTILISDFPQTGHSTRLDWVTAKQAFVVTDSGLNATANHACDLTQAVHGVWNLDGTRLTFNRDKMTRIQDPESAAPCTIVANESNSLDTYTVSYAPYFQKYMFLKLGSLIGVAYLLEPVANNVNDLSGLKQNFWTDSYDSFGNQTPATAKRISTTASSSFSTPRMDIESMIRATQAIGSLGR